MQDHIRFTAYFLLLLTFISLYLFKNIFVRGFLFALSLFFALYAGAISWLGLGLILAFASIAYCAFEAKKRSMRNSAYVVMVILSAAILLMKIVPGIYNWPVVSKILLSPLALPYSMWFTFDKSLIGLFFICFSIYSFANEGKRKPVLKKGLWLGLLATVVLIPTSLALGYVAWDVKWTNFIFLFAMHNLFFVCMAEEAFFRGMIQRPLMTAFKNTRWGNWVALLLASLLFGAVHFPGGLAYMGLATLAGLFYGYAFIKTNKIEGSIIAHFIVNMVHFIFFTYPALNRAL
jgi:membrane protease YdiL (CAAX protease family)